MERKRIGIRQDGMEMTFTPGKNGSLRARALPPKKVIAVPLKAVKAKVIMPKPGMEGAFTAPDAMPTPKVSLKASPIMPKVAGVRG